MRFQSAPALAASRALAGFPTLAETRALVAALAPSLEYSPDPDPGRAHLLRFNDGTGILVAPWDSAQILAWGVERYLAPMTR